MSCSQCKYEFCWMCMGDWAEHGATTGGYYKCNKYDPSKAEGADDDEPLDGEGEDAERRAADHLAGRLQGIIAEARRRGGEEPVVELRMGGRETISINVRALVSRHGGSAILRPGSLQIRGTGHVIAARKENYRVYEHPDTTRPLSSPRSPCTQTFAPPNAAGGGGPGGANDAAFGGGGGGIATSFGPSFEQRAHLHM